MKRYELRISYYILHDISDRKFSNEHTRESKFVAQ